SLPILDALSYLHRQELVHGHLKPTNIMVVGDQLKLAGDPIRRASEGDLGSQAPSTYDPPEGQDSGSQGDIWALGVTAFVALSPRPAPYGEPRGPVVLPSDFPPAFRDFVTRCLNPSPHDRPSAKELLVSAGGRAPPVPAATIQPATPARA